MNRKKLTLEIDDLKDFATGAAFLGAGGGGDPYVGRLLAKHAMEQYGTPEIIDAEDLSEDDLVLSIAMIGAPTVLAEKIISGEEVDRAIALMTEALGSPPKALMPIEIGGVNSCLPVMAAARASLPLLNADGMGRAFPELQMVTFNIFNVPISPIVVVDEHLDSAVLQVRTAEVGEKIARAITVEMGAAVIGSCYPLRGRDVKAYAVKDTISLALNIGRAIENGKCSGAPVSSLINYLRGTTYYKHAYPLYTGKVLDLERSTSKGFSIGNVIIGGLHKSADQMHISFQNENLIAVLNGKTVAVVPDLICIVDTETATPIPCDALRYGQRVTVIGASAPDILRIPQSLKIVGPEAFGLDGAYIPIECTTTAKDRSAQPTTEA